MFLPSPNEGREILPKIRELFRKSDCRMCDQKEGIHIIIATCEILNVFLLK